MTELERKILVLTVAIVAGAMMATSLFALALAAPATKVPASTHLISMTWTVGPVLEPTPSGIVHIYGEFVNERTLTIGGDTYDVYVNGIMNVIRNTKSGVSTLRFTAVWYVGSLTGPTSNGFSVNLHQKVYTTLSPPLAAAHGVWQGFGSFAQYTLKMEYEGPQSGATDLGGYCIIPNS